MIGTEFFHGQGFGNQLFCYVSSRCVALDRNCQFATAGQELFGAPRWNQKGAYFMELDLGVPVKRNDFLRVYQEKVTRYFQKTCRHDRNIGCDVSEFDPALPQVADGTMILGNMQSEQYFARHREEIKSWLKIKPGYESNRFSGENLCVINVRGGEYVGLKELFLPRSYWLHGMANMRKVNPRMEFVVISDDLEAAKMVLPEVPAYHFDLAGDYVALKNARYLLLSNSSFAFFPTYTNEIVQFIIAPKFWARHNVSNGYWGMAQNIYSGWTYQDRAGRLFSARECREELTRFEQKRKIYHQPWLMKMVFRCGEFARKARADLGQRKHCLGVLLKSMVGR